MKILIIKLGALGDVIIATPVIKAIQHHHKSAEVWLLTTPVYAELFRHWSGLRIKAIPREGLKDLWRMVRWIRAQRFSRLYDLQSNDRTIIMCALSGVAERVGNHPRFPYTHHPRNKYTGQRHILPRLEAAVASAGVAVEDAEPYLPLDEQGRCRVAAWMTTNGLRRSEFVVMHAGSSLAWPSKRWPYYKELAIAIERVGYRVVWAGAGPDAKINRLLAAEVGIDATAQMTIAELCELGRLARFAVTNDSAPMHVFSCSGIPVYALFGPSDPLRSHAVGQGHRVLKNDQPCPACQGPNKRTAIGHTCLTGISVDRVLARLNEDKIIPAVAG